jgi:hypothetical protein
VSLLTGIIVGTFGVSAGAASAIAAAMLLVPMKIGVKAWCVSVKKEKAGFSYREKQVIAELADKQK